MSIEKIVTDKDKKYDAYFNDINLVGTMYNSNDKSLGGATYGQEKITAFDTNVGNISNVRVLAERKGLIKNYGNKEEYIEYKGNFWFDILNTSSSAYVFELNVSDEGVENGVDPENVVYEGRMYSQFSGSNPTEIASLDYFLPTTPLVNNGNLQLYYRSTGAGLPVGAWQCTFRVLIPVKA